MERRGKKRKRERREREVVRFGWWVRLGTQERTWGGDGRRMDKWTDNDPEVERKQPNMERKGQPQSATATHSKNY